MPDSLLKDKLHNLRKSNNYTQNDIAQYLNMTRAGYGHYEKGKRTPNPETLLKLAKLYNIEINELINCKTTPIHDDKPDDNKLIDNEFSFFPYNNQSLKDSLVHDRANSYILSNDEIRLVNNYRKASENNKKKMLYQSDNFGKESPSSIVNKKTTK